jgi:tetratricopeptide (TPR) repeat protein
MRDTLRHLIAPIAITAICPVAMAQFIEDVEVRREGPNAVANIRFVTGVQLQKVTTSRARDLGQAYYNVLPTREAFTPIGAQRRIPATGAIPEITIIDESVGRSQLSRKLIVRLSKAVPFRIRAGQGNRSIEVVLAGLGESVQVAPTAGPATAAPLAPDQNFMITLQSSPEAGHRLTGTVPAKLQDYQTFTGQRTVDGRVVYDINMGYFATRAEAESALSLLLLRFPQATVVALQKPAAAAAAGNTPAEVETRATALMNAAKAADAQGDLPAVLDNLGQLLNLPPNAASRQAQEMIGTTRLKMGDTERARAEFDAFLNLYPTGADSDRVRQLMAGLPAKAQVVVEAPVAPPSNWSGSVSTYYFGGKSKERNQEFLESPISGLLELASDNTISDTDLGQVQTSVDLRWQRRDAEADSTFVFRDAYTANLENRDKSKNRLSALYFDRKSRTNGTQFRIGRQSPIGGGILYRFDGVQAGYTFKPKWRVSAAAGVPTDDLLETQRRLYSVWLDAEALTDEISGSLYLNQQTIDGEVDRRAVGTELRYFKGGVSVSSQFDYDTVISGMNIASVQGTWQLPDTTIFNFLYDRRATPLLSLGNMLFFQDPSLPTAQRVSDLLATNTLDQLRQQVKAVTAYQTQFLLGVTTPLNANWQIGGDIRLSNVGEIKPVPVILPDGQPSTGNVWSVGGQLIGSNLYSQSDTHVFVASTVKGPTYTGYVLSYNNMTTTGNGWRLEPSLRYYRQSDTTGTDIERWTPGMRASYKLRQQVSVETELSWENSKVTGPLKNEASDRLFYYLGARYDF